MVFVSRVAASEYRTQSVALANGGSPVPVGLKSSRSGGSSGNSLSGSDSCLPSFQMIGNGSPQYRCRENSQSRSL